MNSLKLTYGSSIYNLSDLNSSFDRGILRVAYVGENRNGSSISKQAFENAIPSIYNCPVVCNYSREDDAIGSHDVDIVMKDGRPVMVNITQPVGVIPESANYWWEVIEDDSGAHEYLCVDVIIWKRQEAYQKIKENGITDESMEIRVVDGRSVDGVFVIDRFEFLAFCLLESAEPCYESASLELFSMSEFRDNYTRMMEEFKKCFSEIGSEDGASDPVSFSETKQKEGGVKELEEKLELLARFGMTQDSLDFDIQEMSLEDLEAKLNEMASEPDTKEFALTGEQMREELVNALHANRVKTEWGDMPKFIYCDYDPASGEVYGYDSADWKLYGFTYQVNGDVVTIDFESQKRKKFAIVDFEGETETDYGFSFKTVAEASAESARADAQEKFEADKQELEQKCETYSNEIEQMNQELNELRDFKSQALADERAEKEAAVFAMFEDLNGIEAFDALRGSCAEMSIEDIEEKCYAIRGRNTAPSKGTQTFSAKKSAATRLPVDKTGASKSAEDEPYGGLFLEFPPNQ